MKINEHRSIKIPKIPKIPKINEYVGRPSLIQGHVEINFLPISDYLHANIYEYQQMSMNILDYLCRFKLSMNVNEYLKFSVYILNYQLISTRAYFLYRISSIFS